MYETLIEDIAHAMHNNKQYVSIDNCWSAKPFGTVQKQNIVTKSNTQHVL